MKNIINLILIIRFKIKNIISSTNFNKLKKEELKGFVEATKYSKFFSRKKDQWKDKLSTSQIKLLEKKFNVIMKKFNYFNFLI